MHSKAISCFGSHYREVEIGEIMYLAESDGFTLESGAVISNFPIAYQTFGTLNRDKSNAILICHALTGDQYVIGEHPVTGKAGWWERMVGPGKVIDTTRFFVISSNVIGGCMGSFGPKHINSETGQPYGLSFPVVTIADMVRVQKLLIEKLGIQQLFCILGGSMGGMQVLEWAAQFPHAVYSAVPIAATTRHSAQNIAFHEIGRQAIMADPQWQGGDYLARKSYPGKGLSVARMAAHVTYLSENALQRKFGRDLQNREAVSYGFEADFKVESYLRHQGQAFVERFDANSYLYITRAMDYFDLSCGDTRSLSELYSHSPVRFCVFSFSSDWLFPTEESRHLVRALSAAAADVTFSEIKTDKGHDAFLLEEPEFDAALKGFIEGSANRRGLA
uniref:Homoserine O-acetyltransferase n=1 Tax=uncultured bacterium CSL1 TaxID=1091565 RepID=G4WVA5_9BACT|nr:homoserine O-acetyltransferase [uncultured bacterium CSL1]